MLTVFLASLLAIGFLIIPGFLHIKTNQADFTVSVNSTSDVVASQNNITVPLKRGANSITISKPGYYPLTKNINALPLFQYNIQEDLQPKILKRDLETTPQINLSDGLSVTFCDSFKNSACLMLPDNNPTIYNLAKDLLISAYSQDKLLLPLFANNVQNDNKSLIDSSGLSVYLASIDGVNKPVLYIKSSDDLSVEFINKRIRSALANDNYEYYTVYANPKISNYNTLPKDISFIWYDEDAQFGADYV